MAAARIYAMLDRRPSIDSDSKDGVVLSRGEVKGEVVLEGVRFSYPTRPDVVILDDLSLHVPAATTMALVGSSGSGKEGRGEGGGWEGRGRKCAH